MAERWLDAEEMRAWRSLVMGHAALSQCLDQELRRSHGLGLAEYEVMVLLSEADGHRMRMTQLAEAALVSPSGLTRRLDQLVTAGLVGRETCPTDRRGTLAVLTDAGFDRLKEMAP